MIKLAIAILLTLAAVAVAMSPASSALAGVDALFILLGVFVVAIASLNAVQNALR